MKKTKDTVLTSAEVEGLFTPPRTAKASPEETVADFTHSVVERNQFYRDTLLVAAGRAREAGLKDLADYLDMVTNAMPGVYPRDESITVHMRGTLAEVAQNFVALHPITGRDFGADISRLRDECLKGTAVTIMVKIPPPAANHPLLLSEGDLNHALLETIKERGHLPTGFVSALKDRLFRRGEA